MEIIKGALYVCNHSGGKDSQAMYLFLRQIIPADQLIVIHSHLGKVEWSGTIDHIKSTISHELFVVKAGKTFLEMVRSRGMWPSVNQRQCTSDLKRDPINKEIRRIANERGFKVIVNCTGIRAQESTKRAKKNPWRLNRRETNGRREWFEWMPIFHWSQEDVFSFIADNGQEPHWAYKEGMSRLSCCFCIMAKKSDLMIAARLNPELFQEYLATEREINHTFITPKKGEEKKWLDEYLDIKGDHPHNKAA